MGMVRSPKSIAGAVALALGNAPYQIGDRALATTEGLACSLTQILVSSSVLGCREGLGFSRVGFSCSLGSFGVGLFACSGCSVGR
ncbi:hypothetical protein ED562_15925 [Microcystis aeruginosa FACHB-524]|nr:hypothetical protein ED562_15925 [Microcystis aeruginosa FACHB-524]